MNRLDPYIHIDCFTEMGDLTRGNIYWRVSAKTIRNCERASSMISCSCSSIAKCASTNSIERSSATASSAADVCGFAKAAGGRGGRRENKRCHTKSMMNEWHGLGRACRSIARARQCLPVTIDLNSARCVQISSLFHSMSEEIATGMTLVLVLMPMASH
jgi:hypothetical protein